MTLSHSKYCVILFFLLAFSFKNSYGIFLNNQHKINDKFFINIFMSRENDEDQFILQDELLSNVEDFINLPEGGTPWEVFGETGMDEYSFEDDEGYEWIGVRPEFTQDIKKLDTKKILVQGYMFPLDHEEKQKTFLLTPFPQSCPYYPHVSSNLIIEVHAKDPISFSYDAVDIEGILELVPNDDLYNVFFRLKNAQLK